MAKAKVTTREAILQQGIGLTTGDRNDAYGDPQINLQCQEELWLVYEKFCKHTGKDFSLAHQGTMKHVFAKLARIACGSYREDNYVDGATYMAIAGEQATKADLDI